MPLRSPSAICRPLAPAFLCLFFALVSAAHAQSILTVTTAADELDTPAGVDLSLREAIRDAAPGDTIDFNAALRGQTLTLDPPKGEILIDKDLSIDASALPSPSRGIPHFEIDADLSPTAPKKFRVIRIPPSATVILRNLLVTGGRTPPGSDPPAADGGGILNEGALTLDTCSIIGNRATGNGGGMMNTGTLTSTDSFFIANSAGNDGGAISIAPDSRVTLTNCSFRFDNDALSHGGAIYCDGGYLETVSCTIRESEAGTAGSGIAATNGATIAMKDCTVANNRSFFAVGSAIYAGGGSHLELTNCVLEDNEGVDGGGIYAEGDSMLYVTDCTIYRNGADSFALPSDPARGGAIFLSGSHAVIRKSFFSGNGAEAGGGAIWSELESNLTLINSSFTNNGVGLFGAADGGTITTGDGSILAIRNCTLSGNRATTRGGGVHITGGAVTIENSIIAGNTPTTSHVDIFNEGGTVTAVGANLIGNNEGVETEFPDTDPLVGTAAMPLDPLLSPAGDYGGPTATLPPTSSSPAIDAAIPTADSPPTDQRGVPRPTGAAPDLGAVEQFPLNLPDFIDTDGDFMDDRIEPLYGFVVGTADGHLDPDFDGSTNADELGNITHPLKGSDFFQILKIAHGADYDPETNRVFDITWKSFPGLSYTLECDAALDFAVAPVPLGTFEASGFTETQSILFIPPFTPEDFLRVRRE